MSTAIRVIPCLDVNNGRVVKGVPENLRDAESGRTRASIYRRCHELTFLDVTATTENHDDLRACVDRYKRSSRSLWEAFGVEHVEQPT